MVIFKKKQVKKKYIIKIKVFFNDNDKVNYEQTLIFPN